MPKRFVLGAAVAGLLLRLAFSLGYWVNQPLNRDEVEYLSLARSLAAGHGYVFDATVAGGPVEPYGRAPGYPAFLAVTGASASTSTHVPVSVKVAQALAGAAGVWLIALLAWKLSGARAAKIAAAMAACYPPLVWIAGFAFSEAIFWPIGLALVLAFNRIAVADRPSPALSTAVGVLAGVSILVRAATLIFLPLGVLWLLWRRRPLAAVSLALGAALVIGPWTVRNYRHYGRFVLVATDGGVTFWTGNNPGAIGEGDQASNPNLKLDSLALKAQHPGVTEELMEPIYYKAALDWIRAHPIDWIVLEFKKLFYLVVPIGPSYTASHSSLYYAASVVPYAIVLPLAIVGFVRLGSRRAQTPGLWLLAGSVVAVCLIFFPQERFRIPVLDPMLIVCAASLFQRERGPRPGASEL